MPSETTRSALRRRKSSGSRATVTSIGSSDRVAKENRRFEASRFDVVACQNMLFQLYPLQNDFLEGPFQAESLFEKVLGKIVEEEWTRRRESKSP